MTDWLTGVDCLPAEFGRATLVGRVWRPDVEGPALVRVTDDGVFDVTNVAPTCSQLLDLPNPGGTITTSRPLARVGSTKDILANSTVEARNPRLPWFVAPCDLQAVKASGVTFVASLL